MEETKDPKASTEGGTPERDAEATSSETLSDIESGEKVTGGGSAGGSESSSLEGSSPKPDTGGGGGRADGSDTGGPM
ncbi:MAG TPA: hypothetical protein VGB98_18645 [Pyrinomonadaceae bacterium]|jgi:hypothetical protein